MLRIVRKNILIGLLVVGALYLFFFFQAEDGIRDWSVTGVQTCALPISAWSLDLDYQHNDGVRPNNDLERIEWYSTIKQQITAQDSVLLLTKFQDYHAGEIGKRRVGKECRSRWSPYH